MCRVDIVLVSPLQSTRRESKILRATKRCTKSTVNLEEGEVLSKIFIVINQEDIEVINGVQRLEDNQDLKKKKKKCLN